MIAHRGGNPENTLRGIRNSYKRGAEGVELDIRVTSDGKIIVCHDENLERLTGGKRKEKVSEISWDELREIEILGSEHVPLLSQALEVIQEVAKKTKVKLDLKIGARPFRKELYNMLEPYVEEGLEFLINLSKDMGEENMRKLATYWEKKSGENVLLEVPGVSEKKILNAANVICYEIYDPRKIPKIPKKIAENKMIDIYIAEMDKDQLENILRVLKRYTPDFITINHHFDYLETKTLLMQVFSEEVCIPS